MANYSEQNNPLKFFKLIKQKIYHLKNRNYKTKTCREVSRRMKPNQPLTEANAGLWFSVLQRQKPNPGPILGSKSDRRPYTTKTHKINQSKPVPLYPIPQELQRKVVLALSCEGEFLTSCKFLCKRPDINTLGFGDHTNLYGNHSIWWLQHGNSHRQYRNK